MTEEKYELLSKIDYPADLRKLDINQLPQLCDELRQDIIDEVSVNPGHFASSLGVVEITVALHYVFNTPDDRIVWDVGHQAYGHKILTGRRRQFCTNRMLHGIRPFPSPAESPYDTFPCGHASNSISAALGMAVAAKVEGKAGIGPLLVRRGGLILRSFPFRQLFPQGKQESELILLQLLLRTLGHDKGGLELAFPLTGLAPLLLRFFVSHPLRADRLGLGSQDGYLPEKRVGLALQFPGSGHQTDRIHQADGLTGGNNAVRQVPSSSSRAGNASEPPEERFLLGHLLLLTLPHKLPGPVQKAGHQLPALPADIRRHFCQRILWVGRNDMGRKVIRPSRARSSWSRRSNRSSKCWVRKWART